MIDIASSTPNYKLAIQNVGIKNLDYSVMIPNQGKGIANFNMTIGLNADKRGTHMSRFIEVLQQQDWEMNIKSLFEMHNIIEHKFDSKISSISAAFTLLIEKSAPISGIKSLSDYKINYISEQLNDVNKYFIKIEIPVTTLCPCSKSISKYGAHSQRTKISVCIEVNDDLNLTSLIRSMEKCGSSELYSLLKREDEKFVTETAYDNPKFVEDSVREAANTLQEMDKIKTFSVIVESLESIHNHSAIAKICSAGFTNPEFV
ncbi:MAG: GTP cyclohydrolase I FolE2 [Francisellaceae bacterium]|jgi:GTP cyclohydrolase IB|nr:GTP cyclohydrolase I FolE2 [Francisellaceae bacterium]MBT6208002.1 GTP cyclohydrolase I FolE2 [Francisellaceae bacterium]MBT6539333.1 GTP cyclohydrolase I FolE2 [Francisellaceae bacterium]